MRDLQSSLTTKLVLAIGADRHVTSKDGDVWRRATDSGAESEGNALSHGKVECSS